MAYILSEKLLFIFSTTFHIRDVKQYITKRLMHFINTANYRIFKPRKKVIIMNNKKIVAYIDKVLNQMPSDWLNLTTHRLDIYDEALAKTQFLDQFEMLFSNDNADLSSLKELPTAFDYIRLGHPLSSILEWYLAKKLTLLPEAVISFSSQSVPALSILRKNLLDKKNTQILYIGEIPDIFNGDILREVYNYTFDLVKIDDIANIPSFDGSTIFISQQDIIQDITLHDTIDFYISINEQYGSLLVVNGEQNNSYISEIQHVRRRETIAMTPINSLAVLKNIVGQSVDVKNNTRSQHKASVISSIATITGAETDALVGSSGLSIQYAIMMGLVQDALEHHKGKDIKFVVPPNCYGGTNDQARRVAACINNVEVVDLPVDGGNDMVQGIDTVLDRIAQEDAIAYIIAEIPTNPRVEVPDLIQLKEVLSKSRKTITGTNAIDPVFILDQTFCPNVNFLGEGAVLSSVRAISYASGSKFPSGGKCTAGYCVGNEKATSLIHKVESHLLLCDNEATDLQYQYLAEQLPSMNQRIADAYVNTREFVNFIQEVLPAAKINFVSEALAEQGFTPSVFSLDLPTKGNTDQEKEAYKRVLNHKLIDLMIQKIPLESKYCVSYGQLKGCYWTIPATSTQGTTKEGDKDYIARVALSPSMDLDLHKKVFTEFVDSIYI